ncbi:MAG: condensation domain-containing protein, partial [Psychrosphaera sp.]|nr:condensation domain-containing protein [Psychrosphaera sp.]
MEQIINHLLNQGVRVFLDDDTLRAKAHKGTITKEIGELIRANKRQLIEYFQQQTFSVHCERPSIVPRVLHSNEPLPLSFAQQRFWFIDRLDAGSRQYNMPMALRIQGDFDIHAAEQAIQRIITRHESLRTVFVDGVDAPVQIIQQMFSFILQRHNLTHLTIDEQTRQSLELMALDNNKAFDLSCDLMVRAAYLQLSPQQSSPQQAQGILLFNMHHIACDGWSMGLLTSEFITQYQAVINAQPDPLAALLIQFADYALWQRDYLALEMLDKQLAYWTQQLEEIPPVHSLPLKAGRPVIKQQAGEWVSSELDSDTGQRLQQVARAHNMTPFMLLHGVLGLVLSRHSNSHDIVIGTPVANRMQLALEPLIGCFINTLVLRVDTDHETLTDYLGHVRQVNLDAQTHQDVPFEQLVEHCNVIRSTVHTPLFQIMFSMNTNEQVSDMAVA